MSSSTRAGRPRKQKKVQAHIAFEAAVSPAEEASYAERTPARIVYDSPKRSSFKAASSQSMSARPRSAPRTSQAQLSFSSVAHSDNDLDIDDNGIPAGKRFAVVIRSPSANLSTPSSNISKKQSKLNPASLVPKMSQPKSKSKLKKVLEVESSSDDHAESDEEDEQPLKKLPNPAAKPEAKQTEHVHMDDDEDEEPIQMSHRLASRRKPSFLSDSDEEPLTKPPKAIVKDGEVRIPGEPSPSPSPPPEDFLPKKYVNSRSFIAGGQLGKVRHKHDYEPIVVGRKHTPEKKTKKKEIITLSSDNGDSYSDVEMLPSSSRKKTPSKNKEADEDSYDSEPAGYMLEHQAEEAGQKDRVFGKRATQDEHSSGTPFFAANDDEEDDSIVIRSPTKRPHQSAKKDKKPEPPVESDSEEEAQIMPTPAPRRRLSPPPISDEDDMPIASSQKTPAKKAGSKRARSSSADSDLPVASSTQKPHSKRRKPSSQNSDNDTPMVDLDGSDGPDFENDSHFSSSPQNKKEDKKKTTSITPLMDQATERACKHKKKSEKEKPKKKLNQGDRLANRVRSSQPKRHRTEKEKALELMRRKRNGEKITQVTDSEPDSDEDEHKPKMGMYDTDSEAGVLSHFEDEESEEERNQEKIRKSLLLQNKNKHKESDDEDTFIVEDDDEMLGVPGGLHEIPIEFTNQAHKKLSEHFKDCVEWLVQRRINPGFNKDDPIYVTAFRKIDDDPRGLVNSKLISPVWNAKFIRSLKARPVFSEWEVGSQIGEGKKCDACNRGKHAVSWAVKMSGKPYNDKTMEEIDQSEDEDEDEDDGNDSDASTKSNTIDASGNHLPSSKKTWYLGSTCRANAHAAHGLIHWKFFLDDWVLDKLKVDGWYSPERLAERALMKKKKLTQLSMDIVDDWTSTREMKRRYAEFKERLEEARNLTHERWGNK